MKEAAKNNFRGLIISGLEAVASGVTTLDELHRVIEVGEVPVRKEEMPVSASHEPSAPSNVRVLVVDDEEHIIKMLTSRLKAEGYEVLTARNGKEAIEVATREKPDVVIMDIMMPEMDGVAATKALRARLETAVIPIIMLTAKKDVQSEVEGLDAGADDYMGKPFDGARLIARVKMLLRRKASV